MNEIQSMCSKHNLQKTYLSLLLHSNQPLRLKNTRQNCSCSTHKSRPLRRDLSLSKNFRFVLIVAWLFWFLELVSLTSLAITARLSGSRESLGLPIDQSGSRKDPKAQSSTYPHGNFLDDRLGPGILRDD